jgi:hypothetical protein
MSRMFPPRGRRSVLLPLCAGLLAMLVPACGGGSSAVGAGRGLSLLTFGQMNVDNTTLNARLRFEFSQDVDPASVTNASIQIREGPSFGRNVEGVFLVEGADVFFEPRLAGLCDHTDSGLKPDTQYRVQLSGSPEEFAVRNTAGQPLTATSTMEFHTRDDSDPNKYDDQVPGAGPSVLASTPVEGAEGVVVADGNRIVLDLSENLAPCTVNSSTVTVHMYESGSPSVFADTPDGTQSGFTSDGTAAGSTADQLPGDPFSWGAAGAITTYAPPQRILMNITLVNTFHETQIILTPQAGRFPENALLVVQLTSGIQDYGNQLMSPYSLSFTTQNLAGSSSSYVVRNEGETPWDDALSTAEIDTARAPGVIQGYMLFSGDGDNGTNLNSPSLPQTPVSGCLTDRQANDGSKDDFDPSTDQIFDTGSSDNTCVNSTDGSTAVVWEFKSFHIRNGVTVRVIGNNPAIFLVQGDIQIDAGGRLSVRADGSGGSPAGDGQRGWDWTSGSSAVKYGGTGVCGAGDGGDTNKHSNGAYGQDGSSAFGSVDGRGLIGGEGAGQAGVGHNSVYPGPDDGNAQGGGGGGHGSEGGTGPNVLGTLHTLKGLERGAGGGIVPDTGAAADKMLVPSAGAGGGAGGLDQWTGSYTSYGTGAGAGGAGGGFIDLTSSGNIYISGILDASGSKGGNGGSPYTGTNKSAGAGGGGGAGGGIRLLTPNEIILSGTAVVTAAGGAGGISNTSAIAQNNGANGGNGRVVMEDGDSVISGLAAATVAPTEGQAGFYRGSFDASRFKGGGLTPEARSELFATGAFNPTYMTPIPADFVAGVPVGTSLGTGKTAILIEAQGYQMKPDATPDLASGTGWYTVGHFTDSGVDNAPNWVTVQPSATQLPAGLPDGNLGFGISHMNGCEFLQLRITIYLPASIGPFDAGPFLDDWAINFTYDQ